MIYFNNGGCLVESASELPVPGDFTTLWLDFETSSGDPKFDSLNPWDFEHCTVIGACISFDDNPKVWFVPRRFLFGWLPSIMKRAKRWINHNVKYDHHVGTNDLGLHVFAGQLVCTLIMSKILDADMTYKGGYTLDNLSLCWLKEDIRQYEHRFKPYLYHANGNRKSKDYGDVPIDIMAEYGCQDIVTNRKLYKYITERLDPECGRVLDLELDVTRTLLDIERIGLRLDIAKCKTEKLRVLMRLLSIEEELHHKVGYMFNPTTNADCYDVLCNHFGLPVIAWTDPPKDAPKGTRGNPSFKAEALQVYSEWKGEHVPITKLMLEHRHLTTYHGLFLEPYLNLNVDGILHSEYNQAVRSGRMSCKRPNGQQLSPLAKALILPPEDKVFVSFDLSQIEYRLIAHYVNDARAIAAYEENPYIDYHQWVADIIKISRTPAKTINFMIGFGGGKATTQAKLAQLPEIRERCVTPEAIKAEALSLFNTYHQNLPGLKRASRQAESVAKRKGYVRNAFGRHLHLPSKRAHIAFNRAVQSTAADIAKDICVRLYKQGLTLHAVVHDEFLISCDRKEIDDVTYATYQVINTPSVDLRVPVRGDGGWSDRNWADVKSNKLNPADYESGQLADIHHF